MTASTQFDLYAAYYDLLYADKDYAGETRHVVQLLQRYHAGASRLLEFGCGSGLHAQSLAQMGYHVTGVERSELMFNAAADRAAELVPTSTGSFNVMHSAAEHFRSDDRFDAVLSLFHVVSYQTDQPTLEAFFQNARRHLTDGGLFLFDVWYGPAVLTEQPQTRVKRMTGKEVEVVRIAEPTLRKSENIVDVDYEIFAKVHDATHYEHFTERHSMRYLFTNEIQQLAEQNLMRCLVRQQWMTGRPLDETTWGACFVLRAEGVTNRQPG